jgi:lambda family phage tail tape measure protein
MRTEQQRRWLDEALVFGEISSEQYAKAMDQIERKGKDSMDQIDQFALEAARNIQDAMGDGLYDLLSGNFDDIGKSWSNMIMRMAANAAAANLGRALFGDFGGSGQIGGILGSLGGAIAGGLGMGFTDAQANNLMTNHVDPRWFATGGVVDGAKGLSAYSNQILTRPTLFAFARGAGIAGEAGPEAIMPLKRGPDGRLGVSAAGGSQDMQPPIINITNNGTPQAVQGQPRFRMDEMRRWVIDVALTDIRDNGRLGQVLRKGV